MEIMTFFYNYLDLIMIFFNTLALITIPVKRKVNKTVKKN